MIFNIHFDYKAYSGSASSLRPNEMKKAFEKAGYDVVEVEGNWSQRQSNAKKLMRMIKEGWRPKFLYAESSTTPHQVGSKWRIPMKSYETKLARLASKHGIGTALFYWDVY